MDQEPEITFSGTYLENQPKSCFIVGVEQSISSFLQI